MRTPRAPNIALIGTFVLNVTRVEIERLPPSKLSNEPLYQITLITSKGKPSKQFALFLDEELAMDLRNQLTISLLPEPEDDHE